MKKVHTWFYFLAIFIFAGCAADGVRDGYASLRTKLTNGFQDISVEVAPAVNNVAKIEDVKIEASGHVFNVIGFITFAKSCKFLSVEVKFFAKDGSALGNTKGFVQSYSANDRSRFKAALLNLPTSSSELLSKGMINAVNCQ